MINPISFLWRQLNGPQVTAFCQGIYLYFKETYDDIMEYWRRFSISTADNEHLTLLGALQGLARPILDVPKESYVLFTEVPEEGTYYPSEPYHTSVHGLSDMSDLSQGGLFTGVDSKDMYERKRLDAELFRIILKASSATKASQGSLAYLDDILWAIWKTQQGTDSIPSPYTFKILEKADLEQFYTRACGDVVATLGRDSQWVDAYQIVAELRLLGKTLYYPTPTLYAAVSV